MLSKNVETFIGCDKEYDDASIIMFGAPFDSTTSFRPGARFGPAAIRSHSYGLETYSPYQNKDLMDKAVFDGGDMELSAGNTDLSLNYIEEYVSIITHDNKIPFMIGGEHLVTLGALRSIAVKYPDVHIIHIDAHADLRNDYMGATLSHATVMRRAWNLVGDNHIFQLGIRSGDKEEFEWAKDHVSMEKFHLLHLDDVIRKLKNSPVYLTLDLDVLDPAVFPGTGTPEPGGLSFTELLTAILLVSGLNVVGCDVVELSPHYDPSGASTMAACKIIRELLIAIQA